jgi:cytochrome c oxidase subunit IV
MPWYFWVWPVMFILDTCISLARGGQVRGRYDASFMFVQCATYAGIIVTMLAPHG